jgi:hypothetical protein
MWGLYIEGLSSIDVGQIMQSDDKDIVRVSPKGSHIN